MNQANKPANQEPAIFKAEDILPDII